jgi:hypothetical protein
LVSQVQDGRRGGGGGRVPAGASVLGKWLGIRTRGVKNPAVWRLGGELPMGLAEGVISKSEAASSWGTTLRWDPLAGGTVLARTPQFTSPLAEATGF